METTQTSQKKPKIKLDFKNSKYATGRRKTSIAKVWVKKGSGKIYVNGKLFNEYFSSEFHHLQITRPFEIINQATDYDVRCSVVVVDQPVKLVLWFMVYLKLWLCLTKI